MAHLLLSWCVLIIEDDPVSASILKNRILQILPNSIITECFDSNCVKECLEDKDVVLDCVFMDHHLSDGRILSFLSDIFNKKPLMVSVSGSVVDHDDYDIKWTKPFPPLDQMRRELGNVLKSRRPASPQSDGSEVVHPDH